MEECRLKRFRHMTKKDRDKIEVLYNSGVKTKEIARILGFHLSGIYVELKKGLYDHRNTDWTITRKYSADKAQRYADYQNTAKGAPLKVGNDYEFIKYVERKILKEKKSPAAILGEIQRDNIKFKSKITSVRTLYSYIDKGLFLHVTNKNLLRRGRKKNQYKKLREAKKISKGLSIEDRPDYINKLEEFGHWELDTVIGRKKKDEVLFVYTERSTNREFIIKMPDKSAKSCVLSLNKLERRYGKRFPKIFKSITVDNGCEFQDTEGMERSIYGKDRKRTIIYYCHPYSSWERARNENNNGFIRRFIPKGVPISNYSDLEIQQIEDFINDYPRKIYGYNSSNMQFSANLNCM